MPSTDTAVIDPRTVSEWMESDRDIRIVDVRTPAEYESVHIPGSYNVPLDTLGEHAAQLRRHVEGQVVLVCQSGDRATRAEQRLNEAGMDNVSVLAGGMRAWESAASPVNRGRQRWTLERQVRLVAGSIVLTGVVGSIAVPRLKYLAGAIGAGLTFAALSDTCAMGSLLAKLPYNRTAASDVDAIVAQLTQGSRSTTV